MRLYAFFYMRFNGQRRICGGARFYLHVRYVRRVGIDFCFLLVLGVIRFVRVEIVRL